MTQPIFCSTEPLYFPSFRDFNLEELHLNTIREYADDINTIRMHLKGSFDACEYLFSQAVHKNDPISQIALSYAYHQMKLSNDDAKDFSQISVHDLESFNCYPRGFFHYSALYQETFCISSDFQTEELRAEKVYQQAASLGYLPAILELNYKKWGKYAVSYGFAADLRPFVGKGNKILDYAFGKALKNDSGIGSSLFYEGMYWMEKSCGIPVKYPHRNEEYSDFVRTYLRFEEPLETSYDHDGFRHIGDELILAPSEEYWQAFINQKLNNVITASIDEYAFLYENNRIEALLKEVNIDIIYTSSYEFFGEKEDDSQELFHLQQEGFWIHTLKIYQERKVVGEISIRNDSSGLHATFKNEKLQPLIDKLETIMVKTSSHIAAAIWIKHVKLTI
ncbi:MAG: hypothetical protein FJZ56_05195 [Chlamydiae bacterium]|nr:hypothetical protein [Chlamydiota bacterium]